MTAIYHGDSPETRGPAATAAARVAVASAHGTIPAKPRRRRIRSITLSHGRWRHPAGFACHDRQKIFTSFFCLSWLDFLIFISFLLHSTELNVLMQFVSVLLADVPEEEIYRRCVIQRAVIEYFDFGSHALTPTEDDFEAWWPNLPGHLAGICRCRGFAAALSNLSFQRFVLESRGHSLHVHLAEALHEDAYAEWLNYHEHGTGPNPNDWNYCGREDLVLPTSPPPLVWKWFAIADGTRSN